MALRQGAFQPAVSWVFYLPLAVLGFPPAMFLAVSSFDTLYQFWIHTRLVGPAGSARVGAQHAVAPPRPPRAQPALHRPQPRRHADRLGPPVRDLRARGGRARLRHHAAARELQPALGQRPLLGRDVGRGAAGATAARPAAGALDAAGLAACRPRRPGRPDRGRPGELREVRRPPGRGRSSSTCSGSSCRCWSRPPSTCGRATALSPGRFGWRARPSSLEPVEPRRPPRSATLGRAARGRPAGRSSALSAALVPAAPGLVARRRGPGAASGAVAGPGAAKGASPPGRGALGSPLRRRTGASLQGRGPMVTVCAWCQKYMGSMEPFHDPAVSHGICAELRRARLARRRAGARREPAPRRRRSRCCRRCCGAPPRSRSWWTAAPASGAATTSETRAITGVPSPTSSTGARPTDRRAALAAIWSLRRRRDAKIASTCVR